MSITVNPFNRMSNTNQLCHNHYTPDSLLEVIWHLVYNKCFCIIIIIVTAQLCVHISQNAIYLESAQSKSNTINANVSTYHFDLHCI